MPKLEKGQHAPLNVTQESRHRVVAGLGWDPNEKFSIIDEARELVGGKKTHHDLDLTCFTYDENKNLVANITHDNDRDESGCIYHSGDNVEGLGDGDDEQISAELRDLDENIQHLVFLVTIKSGHTFGEVEVPEIRLADGYSDHNFLHTKLDEGDGKESSSYIFAHIYRTQDGWSLHNVDEFLNENEIDWVERLKDCLITSP